MGIFSKMSFAIQGYFDELSGNGMWLNDLDFKWTIIAGMVGIYCAYKLIVWPRNLPPGPTGLPFVGCLGKVSEDFHKDLIRFSKEYNSDVVSLYIGRVLTVSLNSPDAIKEAFLKSEDFSNRGQFGEIFDLHDQIISHTSYDERWRKLKSFLLSSLRTHGFGTQKSEDNICLQLEKITEALEMQKGAPLSTTQINALFMKATTSVLLQMIASQSYDFDDPELMDLMDRINGYLKIFFEEAFIIIVWMDILPLWFVSLIFRNTIKRCIRSASGIRNVLMKHLQEHRATIDERNPRDLIDDSLLEFKNDPNFTDRMIIDTIIAFIPDATETVGSQLSWCLFYLCLNPEYQEKMVNEISQECGANPPGLKDRGKLLLCEAVILECMRLSSVAAISGAHTCSKDVPFRGYIIPKGTSLQANLYAVHYDEKYFPEPEKFNPYRFIVNGKLTNTENVMPFGLGRRKCVGEPLTRSEIFLYLTGLLQRFNIKFGERPTILEGKGVFRKVPDCKIAFMSKE